MNSTVHILLFDGVCNLCNRLVKFILKRDHKGGIMFSPLQSSAGMDLIKKVNRAGNNYDSVIYIEGDKHYVKSTAILKLFKQIGGGWKLLYGFIIIPTFIRDFFYDLIAINRYRLFGKRDSCMVPSPVHQDRFLK